MKTKCVRVEGCCTDKLIKRNESEKKLNFAEENNFQKETKLFTVTALSQF